MVFKTRAMDKIIVKVGLTHNISKTYQTLLHTPLEFGWCRIEAERYPHPMVYFLHRPPVIRRVTGTFQSIHDSVCLVSALLLLDVIILGPTRMFFFTGVVS